MARSRPEPTVEPLTQRLTERRGGWWPALIGTLAGRAILVGLIVALAVRLLGGAMSNPPAWVGFVDTLASILLAVVGAYFLVRGLAAVTRRLLWRVRRKLIISYIFIGFIPAILLVAFFVLGALLLFSNFSSYLVQARLQALTDQAEAIAQTTALEIQRAGGRGVTGILAGRQAAAEREFVGVSLAAVPIDRRCQASGARRPVAERADQVAIAGPWAHVEPPAVLPPWIGCQGFKGLLAYARPGPSPSPAPPSSNGGPTLTIDGRQMAFGDQATDTRVVARAVAFPDMSPDASPDGSGAEYAVVADLLVNEPVVAELRAETGVELTGIAALPGEGVEPLPARSAASMVERQAPPTQRLPLSSFSFLEYRDWNTGKTAPLVSTLQLGVAEIYQKISAAQGLVGGRSFGQGLLVLLMVVGVLFLVIEAVALVAGLALARSITGSVHALFAGTERVRQGDFTHKIAVRARDQLGELAESFNSMTASVEDLLHQAAEKKRLEEELRIAHEIQMSLLPQGPLKMPGLSVTALCVPAREVGGDYYDFLPLGQQRVGVLIADVSGKGTSAALYMAELKGLMLSLSRIHTSPRELLIDANRIIAEHLDARSFITMTYAVIDMRARTMTYARAGHTPLLYLPGPAGASRHARILVPDGLVIGLKLDDGQMFERLLEEQTIPLGPGDVFLLFTDGITEAMDASDDFFGEARLGRLIEEHAHLPAEELRERVLREIDAFVGDAPQHDDMTMILLKVEDAAPVPLRVGEAEHAGVARPVGVHG